MSKWDLAVVELPVDVSNVRRREALRPRVPQYDPATLHSAQKQFGWQKPPSLSAETDSDSASAFPLADSLRSLDFCCFDELAVEKYKRECERDSSWRFEHAETQLARSLHRLKAVGISKFLFDDRAPLILWAAVILTPVLLLVLTIYVAKWFGGLWPLLPALPALLVILYIPLWAGCLDFSGEPRNTPLYDFWLDMRDISKSYCRSDSDPMVAVEKLKLKRRFDGLTRKEWCTSSLDAFEGDIPQEIRSLALQIKTAFPNASFEVNAFLPVEVLSVDGERDEMQVERARTSLRNAGRPFMVVRYKTERYVIASWDQSGYGITLRTLTAIPDQSLK